MIYFKALVLIGCIVAGILFGIANQQPVLLKFAVYTSPGYPLYLILSGCFLAGTLVSYAYGILSAAGEREEERQLTARIQELEKHKARQEEKIRAVQAGPNTPKHDGNPTTPSVAPEG